MKKQPDIEREELNKKMFECMTNAVTFIENYIYVDGKAMTLTDYQKQKIHEKDERRRRNQTNQI